MMADSQHVFAIAPLEMVRDRRLGAPHLRILLALLSFRNREGNLVWPKRERLAEITGYRVQNISKYTGQLEQFGWLEKDGTGGRSMAVRYRITVPDIPVETADTVTESITLSRLETPLDNRGTYPVKASETVTNPVTVTNQETVTNPVTKTVTNPVTRIEQTNEQTNRCANTRAHAYGGDGGDCVEHPGELVTTLAGLGFRAEQVHTPKVMAMLRRWVGGGVTPGILRQLVNTLRARAPNREFGPAYLDAPMHDYLEALANEQPDTSSTTRTADRKPPVSRAKRIADKLDQIAQDDIERNGYVEML